MQWYDGFSNGNVELGTDWQTQAAGFHIYREEVDRAGGHWRNLLRGDLDGIDKRISQIAPQAIDTSKSIEWEFIFQLDGLAGTDYIFLHLFANQAALNNAIAGFNGYALGVSGAGALLLRRNDGTGATNDFINPGWAADVNKHKGKVTREVSGANRFWRLYLDDVLVGGPTNEATYNLATYYGLGYGATNRQRATDILISS